MTTFEDFWKKTAKRQGWRMELTDPFEDPICLTIIPPYNHKAYLNNWASVWNIIFIGGKKIYIPHFFCDEFNIKIVNNDGIIEIEHRYLTGETPDPFFSPCFFDLCFFSFERKGPWETRNTNS